MRRTSLAAALAIFALGFAAHADTILMKDGARYTGRFISGSESSITFQLERGMRRTFDTSQVQSVQFDNSGRVGSSTSSGISPSTGATGMRTDEVSGGSVGVIPAGTELAVRTTDTIDAQSASEGRSYRATVERDITGDNGQVLVPRGSEAELVVRNITSGGTTGSNELVLDVQSLRVNGQRYLIDSSDVTQSGQEGLGANKRTGKYVGGGAVLGTLLGAIAGGGKGAAIGAAAGAAAGAGAQVLTRGKEVKVPPETVLSFRLEQPVRLVRR